MCVCVTITFTVTDSAEEHVRAFKIVAPAASTDVSFSSICATHRACAYERDSKISMSR